MCNMHNVVLFLSLSREGRVIVMSIHQPRYSIFRLCDHVTLMSNGYVVYTGTRKTTLPYFANVLGKNMIFINNQPSHVMCVVAPIS